MAKPLHLFIRPPYDVGASAWTNVHTYGSLTSGPGHSIMHNNLRLRTTGPGNLFAAANGKLSVRPPAGGRLDLEPLPAPDPSYSQAATVDLYLHLSEAIRRLPAFKARSNLVGDLVGFAYLGVDTASLETSLAELLDLALVPVASLPRKDVVAHFLAGLVDVPVTGGHALGKAGPSGTAREIGFAALIALDGPIDPSYVYDWFTDFIDDGQSDLQAFLQAAPKTWPVMDSSLTDLAAINLTSTALYSMAVLTELRIDRSLDAGQWHEIGTNQKALWRRRLLARTGHAPAGSTDPPFEFDDLDWKNVFQLEAIVEFYANFRDPWTSADPSPANPIAVDLSALTGRSAKSTGSVVTLDGTPDLTRVTKKYDTLWLGSDTARSNRLYRITGFDNSAKSVTLDAAPALPATGSSWRIALRPTLVIVDTFGGRIHGSNARANDASTPNVVTLDGLSNPSKINKNFDTIYFPDASGNRRTYRITAVNDSARTVTLDGNPSLPAGGTRWHIPAGVSGNLPALSYSHGPGGVKGFDHYDGVLFVVVDGAVVERLRWSSFSSRKYISPHFDDKGKDDTRMRSSLRGNDVYEFQSFYSSGDFKNYTFKVTDPGVYDDVAEARYYVDDPVTQDTGGKGWIRLHYSDPDANSGSSSGGCLVSPFYYGLRDFLVEGYQTEHEAMHGSRDLEVLKVSGKGHKASEALWRAAKSAHLEAGSWNDKIVGRIWVIRPDEPHLGAQ